MRPQHILVIGHSDIGRRVCAGLREQGIAVIHLDEPSDSEIRRQLERRVTAVAVLLHDDIRALRYALMVEHLRPGIRLFATIFGRTVRAQLATHVPNSVVMSPAAIAVPSMVAAAIAQEFDAVRRLEGPTQARWVSIDTEAGEPVQEFTVPWRLRLRGRLGVLAGQLRPYDRGSSVLFLGAYGLALVTLLDTFVGLRHEEFLLALRNAMLATATVTAPAATHSAPELLWSTVAAFLVMVFIATFGAGIVHHLLEGRHIGLIGRRVAPRAGHVIIAGMGQVGIRLAQELRALGVAVVCIEQHHNARTLPIAKTMGIPVIVDDAASQGGLRRAGIRRAHALVAAGSDERDNIAIAIAARAAAPEINVVLRAGSDDAIDETRSLFRLGRAIDVNALTSVYVTQAVLGSPPYLTLHSGQDIIAIDAEGDETARSSAPSQHCTCI